MRGRLPASAGNLLWRGSWELSRNGRGGRRPHPQNLRMPMGCCALHQSIRGGKTHPMAWESALTGKFGLSCPIVVQPGPQACGGKSPGNFSETARTAAGRTPKLENGLLRTAPINPGEKPTHGKVPLDLGCLARLPHCGAARPASAPCSGFLGNFQETAGAAASCNPKSYPRVGHCGLHQPTRGKNCPQGSAWCMGQGRRLCVQCCLAPVWCNCQWGHKRLAGNFLETSKGLPQRQPAPPAMGWGWAAAPAPAPMAHKWCSAPLQGLQAATGARAGLGWLA